MAFVITDSCVSCGSCAGECPVGAISQGDGKYDIDATAASTAVHVQAYVRPALSSRAN